MIILSCIPVFFTGFSYLFAIFWLSFIFLLIFKLIRG